MKTRQPLKQKHYVLLMSFISALTITSYILFRLSGWGPLIGHWRGDYLFFAVFLILFSANAAVIIKEIKHEYREITDRNFETGKTKTILWSTALVCYVFFIILFWLSMRSELKVLQKAFQRYADLTRISLQSKVHDLWSDIEGLKFFFENSDEVTALEFHNYASQLFRKNPDLHSLVWILHLEGRRFDEARRAAGKQGFEFHLKGIDFAPESPVSREQISYPVFFIEPAEGHENFVGLRTELFSGRTDIYKQVRDEKSLTLVNSTFHPQGVHEHIIVSFILPVLHDKSSGILGYIEGVVIFDRMMASLTGLHGENLLGITIIDPQGMPEGEVIYSQWPEKVRESFVATQSIIAGENLWNIRVAATDKYFKENPLLVPWLVMVAGILFTSVIILFLGFLRLREENKEYQIEETRHAILQSIGDAVIGTNTNSRIIEMNRMAELLTGWPAEEALGKPLDDVFHIVHAQTGVKAVNPIDEVLREGRIVGLANHTVLISRQGERFQIADSAAPVKDKKGNIIGVVLVFRDVTREYEIRESLEESEELFRTVTNSSPVAVMLYQKDRWVYVNPVSETITGYRINEILRMNFWDIVHPDYQDLIKERGKMRQEGRDAPSGYEFKIIRKDGEERWVRLIGTTCIYKGERAGLISVIDITDVKEAEKSIIRERDKARSYLNVADVMMMALDLEGCITMINPKGCEILEAEEKDILGRIWTDSFIPPEEHESVQQIFQTNKKNTKKNIEYHENFILTGRGNRKFMAWHNAPLRDAEGHVTGILTSGTDITEKKRGEEALKQSEEQFRLFFHSATDGMMMHSLEGTILEVNDVFCERLGYPRNELVSRHISSVAAPDEIDMIPVQIRKITEKGLYAFEVQQKTKDGQLIPTEINARLIEFKGEKAILAVGRDISKRKIAENALKQREADLRIILNSIGDAVIAVDADGNVKEINPVAENLLESSGDALTGKTVDDILHLINEDGKLCSMTPLEVYFSGKQEKCRQGTCIFQKKDGSQRRVSRSAAPIRNEGGELQGAVIVLRDVTEQFILEQQLRQSQKLDSIGLLAGGVAHDFNNMLAGIMGAADLISMKLGKNNDLKNNVKMIIETAKRASELTQRLLDFSRKGKVVSTPVDLHRIISDAVEILERSLDRRIEIKKEFKALFSTVIGDPGQLQNAFLNLGINARDALPERGIIYFNTSDTFFDEAFCRQSSFDLKPGPYVRIEVRDNGKGIPADIADHIFEPFFTTKEVGRGTGLGLPAVYGSVKDHGGMIEFESEPGQGTAFRIYLPAESEKVKKKHDKRQDLSVRDKTVLIIEDDHVVRTIAGVILSELGYTVLQAEEGDQGLRLYQQNPESIDIVLLDMVMPKMSGREVFDALRKIDPRVKVVFSSGFSHDRGFHELIAKGARGFIQKPYRQHELGRVMKEALSGD
ncbi:MAG TPA: PAS domain S-box protein [Firmicutes bacterium]|nr:PAS domain S-box protein [Bacillota bacterium]